VPPRDGVGWCSWPASPGSARPAWPRRWWPGPVPGGGQRPGAGVWRGRRPPSGRGSSRAPAGRHPGRPRPPPGRGAHRAGGAGRGRGGLLDRGRRRPPRARRRRCQRRRPHRRDPILRHRARPHDGVARCARGEGAAAGGVPAPVAEVVRHRLSRLPDATRALLEIAAVAGSEFECASLEAATDLGPDRTLDLVEAALLTGLGVGGPGRSREIPVQPRPRPGHDPRRAGIDPPGPGPRPGGRSRPGAPRRRRRPRPRGRPPPRGRRPGCRGRPGPPPVLRAVEVAAGRLAEEQAEDLLRRALGLVDQLPPGPDRDRQRLDVLLRLHASLMKSNGWTGAETQRVLTEARRWSDQLGQGREQMQLLYGAWAAEDVGARYAAAAAVADELLAVAAASGRPADLVVAHLAAASCAFSRGQPAASPAHLERAVALPEGVEDPSLAVAADPGPPRQCAARRLDPGRLRPVRRGRGAGRAVGGRRRGRRSPLHAGVGPHGARHRGRVGPQPGRGRAAG
jgi:hypothetical protein